MLHGAAPRIARTTAAAAAAWDATQGSGGSVRVACSIGSIRTSPGQASDSGPETAIPDGAAQGRFARSACTQQAPGSRRTWDLLGHRSEGKTMNPISSTIGKAIFGGVAGAYYAATSRPTIAPAWMRPAP